MREPKIFVQKKDKKYPFSKGILARSLGSTDLTLEETYSLIDEILHDLHRENITVIDVGDLHERVCLKLKLYNHDHAEKLYRVSRQIAHIQKPIIILIGGGTGVGKSAISLEIAKRLGIDRLINSDTIREIMRYMNPVDMLPTIHESSFKAGSKVTNPVARDKLIYGFDQQAQLVCEGVRAYIQRSIREGFNIIINGIHLAPKYLNLDFNDGSVHFFHYILHLEDKDEHIQRFHYRSEGSLRDPLRYIEEIDNIRRIQQYIKGLTIEDQNAKLVENDEFEQTINTILKDITLTLQKEVSLKQAASGIGSDAVS